MINRMPAPGFGHDVVGVRQFGGVINRPEVRYFPSAARSLEAYGGSGDDRYSNGLNYLSGQKNSSYESSDEGENVVELKYLPKLGMAA